MASFCAQCGAAIEEGDKFCTRCGAPVYHPAAERPESTSASSNSGPASLNSEVSFRSTSHTGGTTMNVVARAKAILFSPQSEWAVIRDEAATTQSLIMGYAAVLAAIPAICNFIGQSLIGASFAWFSWRIPISTGVVMMVVQYVLSLVGVFILGLIINALAPSFSSTPNPTQALKVAVYASTATWVAGVFGIIPALAMLAILGGLYSIYLLYLGLPALMNTPQNQAVGYTAVVLVVAVVIFFIAGFITSGMMRMMSGLPRF